MNSLNSIILEGNLVRDPETGTTSKGTHFCNFSVASNRYYKQEGVSQQEVSFFDVEVWAKQAEMCEKYLSKGRGVRIVGRLKQDRWKDQEGKNHYKIKIVGEHVDFKPKFDSAEKNETQEASKKEAVLTY